jgi:hypothetical protein
VNPGLLALAAVVVEAGCVMVWGLSAQLTAIYNAEFSAAFFARAPALLAAVQLVQGLLGPLGQPATDPLGMVLRLEIGLAVMTLGYAGGLLALYRCVKMPTTWLVVGGALVFRVTLWLLPGLFSTDVFSYVMYGRIAAVYHANPYVQPPADFASDPFLAWVFPFWRDQPSVYGAGWTDFSGLLSALTAGSDNFGQVAAYRIALIASDVVTLVALWWLLGRIQPAERPRAFLLFAWNPLILFDISANAHNDSPMLALLLLGFAPLALRPEPSRGRWIIAIATSVVAATVKYAGGVAALMMTAACVARASCWRERLLRLGLVAVVGLAIVLVLWWPWLQTPGGQTPAALPALAEAAGGRLVLNSAPDVVAVLAAERLAVPAAEASTWMRGLARAAFGLYVLWEVWRLWPFARYGGRPALLATMRASARALLLVPLLVLAWVWSWYFSWSLALVALLGWRSGLTWIVVGYTLVVLPIVYAHQYLGDQLPAAFVLVMALAPPAVALAGRLGRELAVVGRRLWV